MSINGVQEVLVTGSEGFIGKNLCLRLSEQPNFKISKFVRGSSDTYLVEKLSKADVVVHLAGENRPESPDMFHLVNAGLTSKIANILSSLGRKVPIVFSSSAQASLENAYGKSKLAAEDILSKLSSENGNPIVIYRLKGVFGKWSKPNYNSVVATFCHNIARNLPIEISDPNRLLSLSYIDEVVDAFISQIRNPNLGVTRDNTVPFYEITLVDLADQIKAFDNCRSSLVSERVGIGLSRALYATYISFLPVDKFHYNIPTHGDDRGIFVEILKTHDSGQFSFFTAHPGITRGGHYHHTKTEKFLVIKGNARFRFRHIMTDEVFNVDTTGKIPTIVETIPGWSHDITNNGDDELIVMLWANENFDFDKPDTIASILENEKT